MLDIALKFLADELNAHLERRLGAAGAGKALVTALVDDSGKWLLPEGRLGLTLVALDEERTLREQLPQRTLINGNQVDLPPPLHLNLVVLLAARFNLYDQALGFLSQALTFFHAQPVYGPDTHAGLDPRIDKLTLEMLAYGPETLNQTWACLGAKYLPSALYRVRIVSLQDLEPAAVGRPIEHIHTAVADLGRR